MAGLVFLLVFWALAGACQRHGVGGFIVQFIIIIESYTAIRSIRPDYTSTAVKHDPRSSSGAPAHKPRCSENRGFEVNFEFGVTPDKET